MDSHPTVTKEQLTVVHMKELKEGVVSITTIWLVVQRSVTPTASNVKVLPTQDTTMEDDYRLSDKTWDV